MQVVADKKTKWSICTAFANGKRHDFRPFKKSKTKINSDIEIITGNGYQAMHRLNAKYDLPKKVEQEKHLNKRGQVQKNQELVSERAVNENAIDMLKRLKIISGKYRNRRKIFGYKFNIISAFCF